MTFRPRRRRAPLAVLLCLSLLPWTAAPTIAFSQNPATVWINEIHYDNTGTDAGEAIEIAGPAGTNLEGRSLLLINGADQLEYSTTALSGVIPNQSNGFGTLTISYLTNGIQNGAPDGIALVNGSTLEQFLSYEGAFTAANAAENGAAAGQTSTDIGRAEVGTEPVGQSLQLTGTGTTYQSFSWTGPATSTFGAPNAGQTFSGGDAAPSVAATSPANGATGVAVDANVVVTFSEQVDVAEAWYSFTCTKSGTVVASDSSSGNAYTINPVANLQPDDTCTVTVESSAVFDTDDDDPPNEMAADHTFSFATVQPDVPIYEIQGTRSESPRVGERLSTTGVVTANLGSGFFIQDPDGDGDAATSDGMFIFHGSATTRSLVPGDLVRATGTVLEFRGSTRPRDLPVTEMSNPTVAKIGTAGIPDPVTIGDRPDVAISPDGVDAFERLEGMLVSLPAGSTTASGTNNFGEVTLVAPADAGALGADGNINVRDLDGDAVDYNPERVLIDDEARQPGGTGSGTRWNSPMAPVASGAVTTGAIEGPLDYQFSNYRIQPTMRVASVLGDEDPGTSSGGVPAAEAWEGRIATFNVENLFDCVNTPGKEDSPFGTSTTRTACTASEITALDEKLDKLALAFEQELRSPQVAVIEETENAEVLEGDADGEVPGTNIPALLQRLSGSYDAASFDASDVRGIEVAFVFDTARADLVDVYQSTDVLPDSGGIFDGTTYRAGREPLVGEFVVDDVALTIIGNHFKSKGGPQCGSADAPQPCADNEAGDDPLYGTTQPPVRWTEALRHQQADYVRELVDLLVSGEPERRVLVAGDLNDFAFAEPGEGRHTIQRVSESSTAPLTNLVLEVPEPERYTFNFEGNSQVLDHLLANDPLAELFTDIGIAHFNAGYPTIHGDDASVTFRASDHDPIVADFCTDATAPTVTVSVTPSTLSPPNHKYVTVQATVTANDAFDPSPDVVLVGVTSSQPDGGLDPDDRPNDIVVVDADTFRLRAERFGGQTRTYTVTYRATDACGNAGTGAATVTVPLVP